TMKRESMWLYQKIIHQFPWLFLSGILFIIAYSLLFYKKDNSSEHLLQTKWIPFLFILQFIIAAVAYGRAHFPYIIYPILPVGVGMTNSPMYTALLSTTIIGLVILIPAFYLFFNLFFKKEKGK